MHKVATQSKITLLEVIQHLGHHWQPQCLPSLSPQRAQTHICSVLVSENMSFSLISTVFLQKGHPKSELRSKSCLELFFSYRREPQPVGRGWACSGRGVKVGVHNIAPQISLALRSPDLIPKCITNYHWLVPNCCNLFYLLQLKLSHYKLLTLHTKLVIPTYQWPALNPLSLQSKKWLHYKLKVTSIQTKKWLHYKLNSDFITN